MIRYNTSAIYFIRNILNNKIYIGQSIDVQLRLRQHKKELKKGIHSNRFLQYAFTKYGEDNFEFAILDFCNTIDLNDKEVFYINRYRCLNEMSGYNLREGGNSYTISESTILKMRNSKKCKKLYAFTREGIKYKEWDSISMCAKELNISPCDIRRSIQLKVTHCRGLIFNTEDIFQKRESKRGSHLSEYNKTINPMNKIKSKGDFIPGTRYVKL